VLTGRGPGLVGDGDAAGVQDVVVDSRNRRREDAGLATYLVIHTPIEGAEEIARKPSDLVGLARLATEPRAKPRWIKTWSPDLHDDRLFTLWEAESAVEIEAVLERFGFLNDMTALPMRVREWGPVDVLASQTELAPE
jgi:hypothetical protein